MDPDIEYVNPAGAVEPGTRQGMRAFAQAVEKLLQSWDFWRADIEQVIVAGDQVAVVVHYRTRGRGSGIEVEGRESALWTLRDGKVARYQWFHEPEEAVLELADGSRENFNLAKRFIDGFNSGNGEAVVAEVHPEIEFIPLRATIQGSYHGHAGIRKFMEDNEENFDVFLVTPQEIHVLGDRIVGTGELRVRGKGSGVDVTVSTGVVMTLKDGKIVRFEDFGDRAKALEAAGDG
jgi:ketosteroid isomerase-like protein